MAQSYTDQDIQITTTGDLVIASNGDLQIASIDQTTIQNVILNLYTEQGDMSAIPTLGSLVEDFIGEPNTSTTAQLLRSEIIRALTANGEYSASDININIVPVAIDTIIPYITIQNAASISNTTLVFQFSYINGLQLLSQGS